ncbi:hypothetical protein KKB64_02245 [Patescibacteria group bacterium]|nr:hypothetical protein [Patescibacteria group bacterium]MBU1472589.1 hypothetical protein [Patescibacteria group bacterium]MBU2459840.1 hypothetical protein [Patescibacteria group bacterium]MBU2544099.1 hypothetical protein [Patescibacteria group bacterium]
MTNSDARILVNLATEGLVRSAVNGVLWWMYLVGASIGKSPTSAGAYRMFREADKALEEFHYETFKQVLVTLRKQKFIVQKQKKTLLDIEITEAGKKRLGSLLPSYQKKRQWDGYIYLISYDIPEKTRNSRDLLREYLRRIGCGLLQESVWLTSYNPQGILDEFMQDHHITGTVLVSKLDKEGTLGDRNFINLLVRVYKLDALNRRYQEFIDEAVKKRRTLFQLAVMYKLILRDDPQLPFSLLPNGWLGEKAHEMYQSIVRI